MVSIASLHHIRLFYAAYFGALGLIIAFLPVFLVDRGMSITMVGLMTGLLSFSRVLSPPLIGHLLDHREMHGGKEFSNLFIIVASLVAAALALSLAWVDGRLSLALVIFAFGVLWSAMLPLTDGLSVSVSEAALVDYGRLRMWGSIGFVVATLAGGLWLAENHIQSFPWWLGALLLLTAYAAKGFPTDSSVTKARKSTGVFVRSTFLTVIAASFVMQMSHGAYYGLYSLFLLEHGFEGWQISSLWILGVIAEIILMWGYSARLKALPPGVVLGACFVLASMRWAGIGLTSEWLWLSLLQILHAASFAAFHIVAITWVRRLAPEGKLSSAQGWYAAGGYGMGSMLGLAGAGFIAESVGFSAAFFACALVALCGLPLVRMLPKMARA